MNRPSDRALHVGRIMKTITTKNNPLIDTQDADADYWHFTLELPSQTLRQFDPLPLLLQILVKLPELQTHQGILYTILAELYSNALDHGVLKLDSSLKHDAVGFAEYYKKRETLLNNLQEGLICFYVKHRAKNTGGELIIEVTDSGQGFDYKEHTTGSYPTKAYAGRGITLIRNLCKTFEYMGNGNQVRAVYEWQYESGQ